MKIAIAQINVSVGDFEYNKFKIVDAISQAKKHGADLVVFAEAAISGAPSRSLLARYSYLDKVEDTLVEIAAFCDNIAVLIGMPIQRDGVTLAAAAYIKNRHIMRYITKNNLTSDVDGAYLAKGRGCEYLTIAGEKVAVVLGGDLYDDASYCKADTVVVLGADRYAQWRIESRYKLFAEKAYRSDANLIFVNQVGGSREVVFDGSSAAFNAKGEPIALLGSFVEEIAFVDTKADNEVLEVPYQDKIANVYGALTLAIRDYFDKNNYDKACLVMTGGIDTSLAAVLLVDALGAERVVALQMPSCYSIDHSVDAEELTKALGIECLTIPLSDIYRGSLDTIVAAIGEPESARLEADFQLRLRTALFMAVCDKQGYVPVNCSNKTELAIGEMTLYGDTSGMISILGDLYKSDVFALARYVNSKRNVIAEDTLLRAPSAELAQDVEGATKLPPYDVIDAILYRMLERWQDREEIIDAGFDESVVDLVRGRIYGSLDKINQFCPIVAVSPMPLDRGYVDLPR